MAGVAEKARFYLERAVPQLREFEEKEIFTRVSSCSLSRFLDPSSDPHGRFRDDADQPKDEIRTLVSKRTNFEHTVLAPRSNPEDFLAYVQWEQSLGSTAREAMPPPQDSQLVHTRWSSTDVQDIRACDLSAPG